MAQSGRIGGSRGDGRQYQCVGRVAQGAIAIRAPERPNGLLMNRSSEPERAGKAGRRWATAWWQRNSRQAMRQIACGLILGAVGGLGPRSGEAAQSAYPFQSYEVPLYQGPIRYPDFRNRDRAFATYRT